MGRAVNEEVGAEFSLDLLQAARDKTLAVINEAAKLVHPGMTEKEGRALVNQVQRNAGAPKAWHPPQIRFGVNTLLPFAERGADEVTLQKNDIFFFDIGPIFAGHEGDVGRAFAIGDDPEMKKCCVDVEAIWHEVREHWEKTKVSGRDLYRFAEKSAQDRGWRLSLKKANGHRIADFPHAAGARGTIEGFAQTPAPNRWILEIQIRHPTRAFGAFYEDLLG